jgi:hypothetical protein
MCSATVGGDYNQMVATTMLSGSEGFPLCPSMGGSPKPAPTQAGDASPVGFIVPPATRDSTSRATDCWHPVMRALPSSSDPASTEDEKPRADPALGFFLLETEVIRGEEGRPQNRPAYECGLGSGAGEGRRYQRGAE